MKKDVVIDVAILLSGFGAIFIFGVMSLPLVQGPLNPKFFMMP